MSLFSSGELNVSIYSQVHLQTPSVHSHAPLPFRVEQSQTPFSHLQISVPFSSAFFCSSAMIDFKRVKRLLKSSPYHSNNNFRVIRFKEYIRFVHYFSKYSTFWEFRGGGTLFELLIGKKHLVILMIV